MQAEPIVGRKEVVGVMFAVYDLLQEFARSERCSRTTMAKKYKKIWNSKEEYEAHNAHVDETLRRLRELLDKAQAELDAKRTSAESS